MFLITNVPDSLWYLHKNLKIKLYFIDVNKQIKIIIMFELNYVKYAAESFYDKLWFLGQLLLFDSEALSRTLL